MWWVITCIIGERSESDTNKWKSEIYLYICVVCKTMHFSSAGMVLHNVGEVKCHPFLKHSKHWKRTL